MNEWKYLGFKRPSRKKDRKLIDKLPCIHSMIVEELTPSEAKVHRCRWGIMTPYMNDIQLRRTNEMLDKLSQ